MFLILMVITFAKCKFVTITIFFIFLQGCHESLLSITAYSNIISIHFMCLRTHKAMGFLSFPSYMHAYNTGCHKLVLRIFPQDFSHFCVFFAPRTSLSCQNWRLILQFAIQQQDKMTRTYLLIFLQSWHCSVSWQYVVRC